MSPVLQTSLARVMPAYMQAVKVERERPVVMAVLESLTGVLRTCGSLALQPPGRLSELCNVLKAVLQKKVGRGEGMAAMGRGVGPQETGLSEALSPLPTSPLLWKGAGRGPQAQLNPSSTDGLSGRRGG